MSRRALLSLALLCLQGSHGFTPMLSTRIATLSPRVGRAPAPQLTRTGPSTAVSMSSEPLVSGTAIVSGFFEDKANMDDMVFDVVHKHGAFDKIIAYSGDNSFAKKRLLGRKARYTGLLNVLDFAEGSLDDLCAPGSALDGCDAWLSFNVAPAQMMAQAEAAKAAGIKRMVMLVNEDVDVAPVGKVLDGSVDYTIVKLKDLVEGKEGGSINLYAVDDETEMEGGVARDDAIRVVGEALLIPSSSNGLYKLSKGNDTVMEYLKDLRAEGLTRTEEIERLFQGKFSQYYLNKTIAAKEREVERQEKEEFKTQSHEEWKYDYEKWRYLKKVPHSLDEDIEEVRLCRTRAELMLRSFWETGKGAYICEKPPKDYDDFLKQTLTERIIYLQKFCAKKPDGSAYLASDELILRFEAIDNPIRGVDDPALDHPEWVKVREQIDAVREAKAARGAKCSLQEALREVSPDFYALDMALLPTNSLYEFELTRDADFDELLSWPKLSWEPIYDPDHGLEDRLKEMFPEDYADKDEGEKEGETAAEKEAETAGTQ